MNQQRLLQSAPIVLSSLALTLSIATFMQGHSFGLSSNPNNLKLASNVEMPSSSKLALMTSNDLVADVAQSVAASVVNIDIQRKIQVQSAFGNFGGNDPSEQLFNQFFGFPFGPGGQGLPMQPGFQSGKAPVVKGNGSGVIITADGLVLTNNHVVKGADEITVTINDGRKFPGTVVGRDPLTDLAMIRLKGASNLKPAKLGDSGKLRPGSWVLAIGSPLGFDHTVTLGIVSALSRQIPDINSNVEFIQTDAAINPGNSGGPLVNLEGEVIGINTAIAGSGQNIGFAIPVNTVKRIASELQEKGTITRPWIGVSMADLNPTLAKSIGVQENVKGVIVAQVYPDGPASHSGLQQGDIIQRVNGQAVENPKSIQDLVRSKQPGTELNMQILRDGKMQAVSVKTEVLPEQALN